MNVALNENEIVFIFLFLHLPKHNDYVRIYLLAKTIIFSTNAFTKSLFPFQP